MQVNILTPEKSLYQEEASELTVPTELGEITILPGHIALITRVSEGEIIIKTKGKRVIVVNYKKGEKKWRKKFVCQEY